MIKRIDVYHALTLIEKGYVTTYKDIAIFLSSPHSSRVVGNFLHVNPDPIKYPCYKVVNSKGELSRNFADGGIEVQKKRLEDDGIIVKNYKVDIEKYRYKFNK